MTAVATAVLTWRGEALTRRCLTSLVTIIPRDAIVIVDNGSGTGEGVNLAAEFKVASVTLPTNGGVPAGYNAAITWARDSGATHVLLANNDLVFDDPGIVSHLLDHAGPEVAAVGPIIRRSDTSIASAGGRAHRWTGLVRRTREEWARRPYDVDALDGACILVSLDAVCAIGGIAPEFFLYWEETDWCARARSAGLRLIIDPTASVTHVGIGSGNLRQTRRYALRNSLLYVRRNIRGLPAITAGMTWWFGRLPFFIVRRILERSNPFDVLRDAAWAISFHVRDISRRGWQLPATGPDICR